VDWVERDADVRPRSKGWQPSAGRREVGPAPVLVGEGWCVGDGMGGVGRAELGGGGGGNGRARARALRGAPPREAPSRARGGIGGQFCRWPWGLFYVRTQSQMVEEKFEAVRPFPRNVRHICGGATAALAAHTRPVGMGWAVGQQSARTPGRCSPPLHESRAECVCVCVRPGGFKAKRRCAWKIFFSRLTSARALEPDVSGSRSFSFFLSLLKRHRSHAVRGGERRLSPPSRNKKNRAHPQIVLNPPPLSLHHLQTHTTTPARVPASPFGMAHARGTSHPSRPV